MLFNSFEFLLFFLPLALGIAYLLRGNRLLSWIAGISFVFYSFAGHAWFLIPMVITLVLDYWAALKIEKARSLSGKRVYLLISLVGNLGQLAYFKYSGLLAHSFQKFLIVLSLPTLTDAQVAWFEVILPAGISFYTFQTLSYILDVYRRHSHAERNFRAYVAFVGFFPHLVAGPLTRHNQLIPQLFQIAKTGIRPAWRAGIFLFTVGLAKKVLIADRVGNWIDPLIHEIDHASFFQAWIAIIGYSLQIYFDFSGYSDMAIGLGRLFSIELPQNFNSPYQSRNPSEFWRRWHMTLSAWLRDYLYISLGGNRCSPWRKQLNLVITMILGGLWHGANWTFAAWGLYHGLLLVIYHRYQAGWDRVNVRVQQVLTYVLVCFGWVFFRSGNWVQARNWFRALLGLGHDVSSSAVVGLEWSALVALCLLGLGLAALAPNASGFAWEGFGPRRRFALGVLGAVAVLMMNYSSKFLYFQF